MATNHREERRIARQRGAWRGARELKDAEFDFAFGGTPSTVLSRRSASATPRPASTVRKASSASRSSARTPAPRISTTRTQQRPPSRELVTPAQQAANRKRQSTSQSTRSSSAKSRRTTLSDRAAIIEEEDEEDELVQISPDHEETVLGNSIRRRSAPPTQTPSTGKSTSIMPIIELQDDDLEEDELSFIEPTVRSILRSERKRVSEPASLPRRPRKSVVIQEPEEETEVYVQPETEVEPEEEEEVDVVAPVKARRPKHSKESRPAERQRTTEPPKVRSRRPRSGLTIPIRIYRLSKKLKTEADPLGAAAIPSFNPADVLSQCIVEICKTYIDREKNKETRNKRAILALRSFQHSIQDSLFDVSAAQNTVYGLQARLRKVKREQTDLRTELMHVKNEREKVGVQMDQVRIKYRAQAKMEEEKQELVRDLKELREAAQAHRESVQDDDMETESRESVQDSLREVQAIFKNGGLLETVKSWNEYLTNSISVMQTHS